MPDLAAPRPGDPASVGGYTLAGRLGEGGQGIVYLATSPDGAQVALKLLRADLAGNTEASERFVREVAMARRVAPFCTAQVIETGLYGGRPYIVSEYIEGPTLADVVRAQGPRSGTALHRLAIGTITALVAIHQAGIVHRDFKPSNVVLGPDGPRVIDFGIARALDLTSTLTGTAIGTPSYMAPEQLTESSPGPPSDMFAWACTLLYAASGQTPFGQDSVPAVINRILHAEPDVSCLADPALRALATDCLAKDPSRRPTASQALMRLLGHAPTPPPLTSQPGSPSGLLQEGRARAASGPVPRPLPPPPAYRRPPPTRPVARKSTGWIIAAAIAGAGVIVAAATFAAISLTALPRTTTSPSPSLTSPTPTPSPSPSATPEPTAPSIALPGTSVKIAETASDPMKLTSYTTAGGKHLYVRNATGDFRLDPHYFEYALNSTGTKALGTDVDYTGDDYATVSIIDRDTDARRLVKLSRRPVFPTTPRWSPDGRYGLVTLYRGADGGTVEYGYGIIDIDAGTGQVFEIKEKGAGEWRFFWDADGRSVGTWVGGRMKFYDLNGHLLRTLANAGSPVWVEGDDVSPSGTRYLAHCTAAGTSICARPTSGGDAGPDIVPFTSNRLIGWWDDDRLAVWRARGTGYEAVVIDLSGRVVKVLATVPARTELDTLGFRYSRGTP